MQNHTDDFLNACRKVLADEQEKSLVDSDNWSHVDKAKVHADWDGLYKELTPLIETCQPSSAEVQRLVARHYDIVSRFYKPSSKAYIGMSLFYAENKEMREFHNSYHPKMVVFLGEAMTSFANAHF